MRLATGIALIVHGIAAARISRNLEIRGVASCWEPQVPPWHCYDLAVARSMRDCLDGSGSGL